MALKPSNISNLVGIAGVEGVNKHSFMHYLT